MNYHKNKPSIIQTKETNKQTNTIIIDQKLNYLDNESRERLIV